MSTLLVLRHAKSDWSADPAGYDEERPLARRGEKGADAIGRFIAATGNVPDEAVRSPARRVVETLDRAMGAGRWRCPVREVPSIYGGDPEALVAAARSAGDPGGEPGVLLLVGHEPGCSSFVSLLIGGGSVRMPTAALGAPRMRSRALVAVATRMRDPRVPRHTAPAGG